MTLRQICTHIQVGGLAHGGQAQVAGRRLNLGNKLVNMVEALARMIADHEAELMIQTKAQVSLIPRIFGAI